MESLEPTNHIYITKADDQTAQREGLNMMLMMSHATKHGDQQLVITSDVMNIAEILLIWGLPQLPPAHLAAQALSKYRNKEGDLTQADIKCIIAALLGDSFKERSPGKFIPKYKTTPIAKTSTNATQSDSESESDNDLTEIIGG
jgi:hypothetical protein